MRYIPTLLTAIVLCSVSLAQPQHLGVGYSYAKSDGKDGSGAINSVFAQGAYSVPKVNNLSITGEAKYGRELKGYLNETGGAFRSRLLARYTRNGFFAQGGFYAAHIRFANTSPTVKNGYGKSIIQPVAGFGYDYSPQPKIHITGDYLYFLKGDLHATDSNGNNPAIDGTSVTHRIGINGTYEFAPKWLLISNFGWSRNVYTRGARYGAFAGFKYPSQAHEFQIGIGRRF